MRVGELVGEPRLAHPGLADDGDHLPAARAGLAQDPAQVLDLGVAAHEAREAAERRGLQARARLARPRQLEDLDRVREALHGDGPERPHLDVALGQRQRIGRDHDRPGIARAAPSARPGASSGPPPCSPCAGRADGPNDHLTGVQADADADRDAVLPANILRVPLHRLLHPERGVARADRVVLVGERSAEERHDPVAHHLVHGALVAVDGLHHALEHGIEELARLLGIAVGEQLHRALEVGEEDGDLLALALQRRLGREDLLGEVFWRVRLRAHLLRRRAISLAEPRAAFATELLAGRTGRTAARTGETQAGSALAAELLGGRVLVTTLRTLHALTSRLSDPR